MEGPSIVIRCEEARKFVGKGVLACESSVSSVVPSELKGQTLTKLQSWGKHFLMTFSKGRLKVHFLMFGSYRIDAPKEGKVPKLALAFANGRIDLYSCAIQTLDAAPESLYDWRVDLMAPAWDEALVVRRLSKRSDEMVCDVLLDQELFAGSGNIIKNEVLFNLQTRPERLVGDLPARDRRRLVREARAYSLQFYEWKKAFVLKRNWRIYRRRICAVCGGAVEMSKIGKLARVSFVCPRCQP
jgi:endonuclease-8